MRYPTILLIPIGIVAAALTWQTNESGPPAEQVAPQVYSQWCSSCHGPKGRDFIDRKWKFGSSEQDIQRIIRDGYPLLGMPGYAETLSADDINTLSAFCSSKQPRKEDSVRLHPTKFKAQICAFV